MELRSAIEAHVKEERQTKGLAEGTANSKLSVLRSFHKFLLGINWGDNAKEPDGRNSHEVYMGETWKIDTRDLSKDDFFNFVEELRKSMAKGSQKKAFTHLNVFVDWMLDEKKMTGKNLRTNPMRKVPNPLKGKSIDTSREPRIEYTDAQIKHLLKVALTFSIHRYFFCVLLIYFERRVSEMTTLQWKHINWQTGVLTYYDRKNKKWDVYPLNPAGLTLLRAYRDWYQEECDKWRLGKIGGHPEWYMFPYLDYYGDSRFKKARLFKLSPSRMVHTATMGNWYKAVLIKAGLYVSGQVCHTARHYMANRQVNTFQANGVGDATKLASKGTGHVKSETFETHYRRLSEDQKRYHAIVQESEWHDAEWMEGLPGFENYKGLGEKEPEQVLIEEPEPEPSNVVYGPWGQSA